MPEDIEDIEDIMSFLFFLLLAAFPIIEIILFVQVTKMIGAPLAIAIIILTAGAGFWLLHKQSFAVFDGLRLAVQRREASLDPIMDSLGLVMAAGLLILPGFLSDAIGIALLLPAFRDFAMRGLSGMMLRSGWLKIFVFRSSGEQPEKSAKDDPRSGPTIDADYHEIDAAAAKDQKQSGPAKEKPFTPQFPRRGSRED